MKKFLLSLFAMISLTACSDGLTKDVLLKSLQDFTKEISSPNLNRNTSSVSSGHSSGDSKFITDPSEQQRIIRNLKVYHYLGKLNIPSHSEAHLYSGYIRSTDGVYSSMGDCKVYALIVDKKKNLLYPILKSSSDCGFYAYLYPDTRKKNIEREKKSILKSFQLQ